MATIRTPAQPFDAALSLKLDRLIISLDTVPPWNRRAWLGFKKRLAEQRVPSYGKVGRV